MGVELEHSDILVQQYLENQDHLVKSQINQSMRISQISKIDYKISYLMSSSMTGKKMVETTQEDDGSQE